MIFSDEEQDRIQARAIAAVMVQQGLTEVRVPMEIMARLDMASAVRWWFDQQSDEMVVQLCIPGDVVDGEEVPIRWQPDVPELAPSPIRVQVRAIAGPQ